ncbi:MAG: MFS transporter [Armatimonadota bacterium]|nr:MFS transporter [bacterium]MDW8320441.1 MFS transporter [Armatimonadota bacterium]
MSQLATAPSVVRRNILAIIGDVAFFMMGFACFDPTTVMPQFLRELGASPKLIGLIVGLRLLVLFAPQPYVAHRIHGRSRVKPFLIAACLIGRLPMFLLFALTWFYGENHTLVLWAFVLFSLLFVASDGFCIVPWTEIIGKSVPEAIRGRFFGAMQTASSLAALAAPILVSRILSLRTLDFPHNYALLMLLMAIGLLLSLLMLLLIREPDTPPQDDPDRTFVQHLRRIPALWRNDSALRWVLTTQLLLAGGGIASSFYVLYARERFGLPDSYVAIYLTAQTAGAVITGPLWGWMADRVGAIRALQVVVTLALVPPLAALVMPVAWGFVLVFGCLGALGWTLWNAFTNAILSFAPPAERPTYIALQQFMNLPAATTPFVGGLIVSWAGYPAAFVTTAVMVALGAWSVRRIPQSGY